jgi:large subunit ribosomal protein L24
MRIRKGDKVIVRTGKYAGHRTEVIRALPAEGRVVLQGVNVAKRHTKPTRTVTQGGIIDKYLPMPVSSVSLLCGSCHEPTRIAIKIDEDGHKVRVCKKCGAEQ